ncbi:MAG: hypothetical protein ACI8TQ_003924 [Planctomycetota bacterium]
MAYLEDALDQGMTDLPEAEALLRMTLAQIQLDRGRPDLARDHAERAFSLAQHVLGMGSKDRERAAGLLEAVRAEKPDQAPLD